ncbi:MAG: hypothetical protein JJT81_15745 [Rubellimicrobium sp.]|nr:hypothetical protein [Rubellimicrobium sp.]
MHTHLSRRITQLVCAADSLSPATLKSELLDLARHCQVVPANRFLVSAVCGSLEKTVSAVFGPLAMLLVMTEPRRRQVYFAVLARLEADGAFETPGLDEASRADLLGRLVLSRNEDLIAGAYGTCPPGFLRLIGRFGDCSRKPEIYAGLFHLLDEHPDLAQPLLAACQKKPLTDDLITLVQALPPIPLGVRAATRFEAIEEYQQLIRPYQVITGADQLTQEHLRRIADGEAPGNLLEKIYLDLPFPEPILTGPDLTHIPDGQALVSTARAFSNCLASYVAEGLKGERQFYVWQPPEEPAVVFSISADAPFGWYLSEARLAKNGLLPRQLRRDLHQMLNGWGIRTTSSVEKMMGPYRNDVTNFMIDDLLDLDEAA